MVLTMQDYIADSPDSSESFAENGNNATILKDTKAMATQEQTMQEMMQAMMESMLSAVQEQVKTAVNEAVSTTSPATSPATTPDKPDHTRLAVY